jgi:energy-coupling factor transport system substrate-specific component
MTGQATWQIASAIFLLVSIAAAFAWFERSRPPARVVAMVAVLVAFAVIGRVLFAPFPNIKPTTDIVIIAGFALGAEPGLIVGALAALVSNFYFAQGPWTPWQMFAWGMCGLLGALIGRLSRREIARVPLSLCCAAAGLGYGVILNFGSAVNFGGSDLLTSFYVYMAESIPFDAAHAVANFCFCMLAGPMLIRMLSRIQRRSDVIWPAATQKPLLTPREHSAREPA